MFKTKKGLKALAIFEAMKGSVALVFGLGLHEMAGKGLQETVFYLLKHLHLNPAAHFYVTIQHYAGEISASHLNLFFIGSLVYGIIRFFEAFGLWKGFIWTQWFALLTGGIYLPFEIYEMITQKNLFSVGLFCLNIGILAYLYLFLRADKEK